MLKVGIYNTTLPNTDVVGRFRAINQALESHAWLRELFQFPASVYPGLTKLADSLGAVATTNDDANEFASDFASGDRALLHLKANFFASGEAWRVMARAEWVDVTRAFVQQRIAQVKRPHPVSLVGNTDPPDSALVLGDVAVKRWRDGLTPVQREHLLFYTVLGSANQNDRSMVSDGEDALVISNWPAVIPYLDLLFLAGQCEWVERQEQLDALLPRQGKLRTSIAHWFKYVF